MKIFDHKGMMIIPNPDQEIASTKEVIVVKELFCPAGHTLINARASFNGHPGILVKVQAPAGRGLVALSPIYGEKVRVALDVDVRPGEIVALRCPTCDLELPVHSPCSCGGQIIAMFLTPQANFGDSIGVCNRIDCANATLMEAGHLLSIAGEELG